MRSQCPRGLVVICGKALDKSPGQRYQTAAEFAADLRRHLGNEPIAAKPPGRTVRATKWIKRNPTVSTAGAVGLLAIGVVSALALVSNRLAGANADLAEGNARQTQGADSATE